MKKAILSFIIYLFGTIFLNNFLVILFKNVNNFFLINILNLISPTIILIILIYVNKDLIKKSYNNAKKNTKINLKLTMSYYIKGVFLMILSNLIINFFVKSMPINELNNREIITKLPIFATIAMVFIIPFTEEIVFRGTLKDIIKKENTYLIITAFLFGFIHVAFNGDFIYIVPYSLLGYYLGKINYKTNSIFYSYLAHSFHNALCLLMIFLGGI